MPWRTINNINVVFRDREYRDAKTGLLVPGSQILAETKGKSPEKQAEILARYEYNVGVTVAGFIISRREKKGQDD